MIVQETHKIGNRYFVQTYSDAGRYIVGGEPAGSYVEAWDLKTAHRDYTEGDIITEED